MIRCNYSLRYDGMFTMIHSNFIWHSVLRKTAYTSMVSIQMFISGDWHLLFEKLFGSYQNYAISIHSAQLGENLPVLVYAVIIKRFPLMDTCRLYNFLSSSKFELSPPKLCNCKYGLWKWPLKGQPTRMAGKLLEFYMLICSHQRTVRC